MLFGWSGPESEQNIGSPKNLLSPESFFTLIIPARNEETVIKETLKCLNLIDYPKNLYEVLIICTSDDKKTIQAVNSSMADSNLENVKLILFECSSPNKPKALNIGLKNARGNTIGVFDAEDEPDSQVLKIVNSIIIKEKVDVVQSGVQLMNHTSKWFSALNVLEYYFWFKSGLHFFLRYGKVAPLGGNTVFFRKFLLEKIGGWDEFCLTEDADVGIRAAVAGAKIRVVYDDNCLTKEETPNTVKGFIKQRTRWMQGFLQIFKKSDWVDLPYLGQKMVTVYILLSPVFQTLLMIYIPFGLYVSLTHALPLWVALVSYIPFYLMVVQISVYIIGLYKFAKAHNKSFSLLIVLQLIIHYLPYQAILAFSSLRAALREITGVNLWEKTKHLNIHRNNG